jgi:acetylornithine/N-succinyldiaminopimelate aminotransferase
MLGLRLVVPNTDFAAAARAAHMIVIPAGDNVVRLLPPLILDEDSAAEGIRRLDSACRSLESALSRSPGHQP